MKFSFMTLVAALTMASNSFAASGFLNTCSNISLTNLNGDKGRSMILQATCMNATKVNATTQLDLNTCFGWNPVYCSVIFPPSANFTDAVTSCSNNYYLRDDSFGLTFGCCAPCDDNKAEVHFYLSLSKCSVHFSFPPQPFNH